jgi:MFS family permease
VRDTGRRLRTVFANTKLRRIQLALAALVLAGSGYQVALAIVAFREGGADAVGIAFFVQVFPVALTAPFTSLVADRLPRRQVMVAIDLLRCLCTGAVAVAVAGDGSLALVLVLGAPGAIASGAYAPATRALLPSLVSEPEELTAANAVMSGIEHAALLAGPAVFGVLLLVAGPELVFAVGSGLFLGSALLVSRVRSDTGRPPGVVTRRGWRHETTAGLRTVASDRSLRLLIGIYGVQWFAGGALQVFAVVVARDLTGLGDSGVGWLFSALGLGGVAGTLAAVAVTGRRRLSGALGLGVVLWGAPLVLVGLVPHASTALAGLAAIGIATVLVDVSIVSLLQRTVAEEVLGRVFGVLEGALVGMVGVGSLAAPLLIAWLGTEAALVAVGASLPAMIALLWPRLRRVDAPDEEALERVVLLERLEMFAPLPPPTLESLAANLEPLSLADGDVVIRQGDPGDRFYIVRDGTAEVRVDGAPAAVHGRGEGFGEIALLRQVPRTATVSARGPVRLYALDRDVFLSAVTGHPASAAAGDAVAAARLERRRPGGMLGMT